MLFHTEEEREIVLRSWKSNPHKANYGAAMAHVATTNLGIWGDEMQLREDAGHVMACEVERWSMENDGRRFRPSLDQLYGSRWFQSGFSDARRGCQDALGEAMELVGVFRQNSSFDKAGRTGRKKGDLGEPVPKGPLCKLIYEEITDAGKSYREHDGEDYPT